MVGQGFYFKLEVEVLLFIVIKTMEEGKETREKFGHVANSWRWGGTASID